MLRRVEPSQISGYTQYEAGHSISVIATVSAGLEWSSNMTNNGYQESRKIERGEDLRVVLADVKCQLIYRAPRNQGF